MVCCRAGTGTLLYFIKEYYSREGKSIREHAAIIKIMSDKMNIMLTVGDPSAKQSIDDLCFEGIPMISGDNDRQAGRMRVLEYLQMSDDGVAPWPIHDMPAKFSRRRWPRMYVFDTLKEWKREMRYYRWHEGAQREGDREKTEGEDHAMDPTRYICMTRPSPYKMIPRVMQNSFKGWLNRMTESRAKTSYIGG